MKILVTISVVLAIVASLEAKSNQQDQRRQELDQQQQELDRQKHYQNMAQ
jgi:hypothetical protein